MMMILEATGNELEQISSPILHHIIPSPRLIWLSEKGRVGIIVENISNEINMLVCVTFVTKYGAVVG